MQSASWLDWGVPPAELKGWGPHSEDPSHSLLYYGTILPKKILDIKK